MWGVVMGKHPINLGSHRSRDRSQDYINQDLASPERRRPQNAAMDTMSQALRRAARSPFSEEIERAPMLSRFSRPPFISYDGKTNLIEHVSHYIQIMSLHNQNGEIGQTTRSWGNTLPPLLGVIEVIHTASMGTSMT